jgi:DNA-binding FrmR family transcriptional regulator
MKRNEERMTQYNKILESIDQTKTTSSSETRDEYKQFNKDIKKIESQWKQQNSMMKNHDKFFEEIIKQNNATQELIKNISKNINQDHFLTLAQDDVKNKNNNPDFDIQITPQRGHAAKYYSKESVKFKVKANRDCYIKVIYISSIKGKTNKETKMNVLLFPNNHDSNNRIKAGKETTIGKFGELEIQPPFGKDIVTVVASENQFTDIDEMLNSTSGKYYAEITTNVRSLVKHRARGIRVSENFALGEYIVSGYGTDTCFIITQEK